MRFSLRQRTGDLRFDLTSQAFKQNPFPTLARLREAGPMIRLRVPLFGEVWAATSFDAVNELLRDHHRFLVNPRTAGHWGMTLFLRLLPRNLRPLRTHMLARDEPDHRRLRSLVDQVFQRQHVESLRARLEALADDALEQFAREVGRRREGADLIVHFARPLPVSVICELLGLPAEDRTFFSQWASRLTTASSLPGLLWGLRSLSKTVPYLRGEIARQTASPRDGLLSALIQAEEAGDRLNSDELLAMAFLLLLAGYETTLHQIAGSVLVLLDHQEELHELQEDWELIEPAVQELLRFLSFAQFTKPRFAVEDIEFFGQPIRKGQMVLAFLACANSDPDHFEHPEVLDFHRPHNRHVAFGAGIHYCLGALLSSIETEIALKKLFTRFPQLRLAVPRESIRYSRRFGSRALLSLPVRG